MRTSWQYQGYFMLFVANELVWLAALILIILFRRAFLEAPQTFRWQTLVALMLSSQTKDQVTAAAIENLGKTLPGGLTIDSVLDCSEDVLSRCIDKVGF